MGPVIDFDLDVLLNDLHQATEQSRNYDDEPNLNADWNRAMGSMSQVMLASDFFY
jgi:hypothetical protein